MAPVTRYGIYGHPCWKGLKMRKVISTTSALYRSFLESSFISSLWRIKRVGWPSRCKSRWQRFCICSNARVFPSDAFFKFLKPSCEPSVSGKLDEIAWLGRVVRGIASLAKNAQNPKKPGPFALILWTFYWNSGPWATHSGNSESAYPEVRNEI